MLSILTFCNGTGIADHAAENLRLTGRQAERPTGGKLRCTMDEDAQIFIDITWKVHFRHGLS